MEEKLNEQGRIGYRAGINSVFSCVCRGSDVGRYIQTCQQHAEVLESGQVVDTFGKHPTGYINYGKDSRFLVLIVWDKNDRPTPENVRVVTDQQRADLFRTMVSYGGTYRFDGHTVEHHVDISWNETWTGTTVVRDIPREGDKLIYTTRPADFTGDGKLSVSTLIWQKAD